MRQILTTTSLLMFFSQHLYSSGCLEVANYTELRNLTHSTSDACILSGRYKGHFKFQLNDPYRNGDDSGLVLKAPNGYWVRNWTHTPISPLELDWFETIQQGSDITQILNLTKKTFATTPELISNLGLDGNHGWVNKSQSGSSIVWNDQYQALELRGNGSSSKAVAQKSFPTKIGERYMIKWSGVTQRSVHVIGRLFVGSVGDLSNPLHKEYLNSNFYETDSFKEFSFVANSTITYITIDSRTEPSGEHPMIKDLSAIEISSIKDRLYVKYPNVKKVTQSHLNWQDLKVVHLHEPNSPLTIKKNYEPVSSSIDSFRLYSFKNIDEVIVGGENLNLTFWGLHEGIQGGVSRTERTELGLRTQGLIDIEQRVDGSSANLLFNTRHARSFGMQFTGNSGVNPTFNKIENVVVGGKHWNSGINVNSGVGSIHVENVYITDPYGTTYGFTGHPYPGNNDKSKSEKNRGLWLQNLHKATGSVTFQFGGSHWFMSGVEHLGHSRSDPFSITTLDHHVSGDAYAGDPMMYPAPGTQMSDSKLGNIGKMDSIGNHGPDKKFLRTVEGNHKYGNFPTYGSILEATAEGTNHYENAYVDLQLGNMSKPVKIALVGKSAYQNTGDNTADASHGHYITGIPEQPNDSLIINDKNQTVDGGSWKEIKIGGAKYIDGSFVPTTNILVKDLDVRKSMTVANGVEEVFIENVHFLSEVPDVLQVGADSIVYINNSSFEYGSAIEGEGQVYLDDDLIELPYYIGGSKNIITNGQFGSNSTDGWNLTNDFTTNSNRLEKYGDISSIAEFDSSSFKPHTVYDVIFDVIDHSGSAVKIGIQNKDAYRIDSVGTHSFEILSGDTSHIGFRISAGSRSDIVIDNIVVRRKVAISNYVINGTFHNNNTSGWLLKNAFTAFNNRLEKNEEGYSVAIFKSNEFEANTTYIVRLNVIEKSGWQPRVSILGGDNYLINSVGEHEFEIQSGENAKFGFRIIAAGKSFIIVDDIVVRKKQ